jgi:hypothetical protein
MDRYQERIVFYVYQRRGDTYYLIGLLVYDDSRVAPLKRTSWKSVKVTALNLGDAFTEANEFLQRIAAAEHQKGSSS